MKTLVGILILLTGFAVQAQCLIVVNPMVADDWRHGEVIDEVYTDILNDKGYTVVARSSAQMALNTELKCQNSFMLGESCHFAAEIVDRNGNELASSYSAAVLRGFGGADLSQAYHRLPDCMDL